MRDSIYAYKALKADTSLLSLGTTDDTLYQKFYDSTRYNNIGSFQKIIAYIKDSTIADTTQAILMNQNLPTRCSMEENQKIVNSIYLNEIRYNSDTSLSMEDRYRYDSSEVSQLENVAYQNPIHGGDAVFMSRIMLFIDVIDLEMTKSMPINNHMVSNDEITNYKLYPNPNGGEMQFSYKLSEKETGYILIYDLLGKQISSYKLLNDATFINIHEKQLQNGIYFYQVFINENRVYSGKVIICK